MGARRIVVAGASAGGVHPLVELLARLPADLSAAVLVVVHLPVGDTRLHQVLDRQTPLRVRLAEDGAPLQPGAVLIAPPERHLAVFDGRTALSSGPRENGFRPSIDVLFRSAALAYGPGVVGVILSGALDDGAAGLVAVRLRGGVGIVQEPAEARHSSMPRAAIDAAVADHVAPAAKIAGVLLDALDQPADNPEPDSDLMATEVRMATRQSSGTETSGHPGEPSVFMCPDCSGPLYQIDEGRLTRYRCRVGHAWSPLSLAGQHSAEAENALRSAIETLEEKADLREQLAQRARDAGRYTAELHFRRTADIARAQAAQIRRFVG